MTKALILGRSGQMGFYLTEFLRSKDYYIVAPEKKYFDVRFADAIDWQRLLEIERPDEIYNLASLMFAPDSWKNPVEYMQVNGLAPLRLMDAVAKYHPAAKVFQAGSAEMFEKKSLTQWEDTNRLPENPYGLSKMMACEAVRIFREKYKLFACTGIFFNAESPRRKDSFFAIKAAKEAVRMWFEFYATMKFTKAEFGVLEAKRDWGWAPEYVEVAWQILQGEVPRDYCIGTGQTFTCREFVIECLKATGLPEPEKLDKYVTYQKISGYYPGDTMRAQISKANRILNWTPKYTMPDVARMLVEAEKEKEIWKNTTAPAAVPE